MAHTSALCVVPIAIQSAGSPNIILSTYAYVLTNHSNFRTYLLPSFISDTALSPYNLSEIFPLK